eukprot:jgi/Chlat1/7274/Chrsp58S06908
MPARMVVEEDDGVPLSRRQAQHAFMQMMMAKGHLSELEAIRVFRKLQPNENESEFDNFLTEVNVTLNMVSFEVRRTIWQEDGNRYVGLANTVVDDYSKLGTRLQINEIAFFRAILERIALHSNGLGDMSLDDAVEMRMDQIAAASAVGAADGSSQQPQAGQLAKLTESQKQAAIQNLIADGWLHLDDFSRISIGVRSYVELRNWLEGLDIPECKHCEEVAVKAQICENRHCGLRYHWHCAETYFLGGRHDSCPKCEEAWLVDNIQQRVQASQQQSAAC